MSATLSTEIVVKVNQPFRIVLHSKATAGYDWQLKYDPSIFVLTSKNYVLRSKMIGASADIAFRFKSVAKGNHQLLFLLQRPWETKPIEKKMYHVQVH